MAEQMWQEAYSESGKYGFGHRLRELHLLSGLVLPIWPELERILKQQSRVVERRLNVVRLETTGGAFRHIVYSLTELKPVVLTPIAQHTVLATQWQEMAKACISV